MAVEPDPSAPGIPAVYCQLRAVTIRSGIIPFHQQGPIPAAMRYRAMAVLTTIYAFPGPVVYVEVRGGIGVGKPAIKSGEISLIRGIGPSGAIHIRVVTLET